MTAITVLLIILGTQTIVGLFLIWRVYSLSQRLDTASVENEQNKAEAAADRKLTHELLTIVKGWALIMERQDKKKAEKLEEVAVTAAKTAIEVKEQIAASTAEVIEGTANKVIEKIAEKAASDSVTSLSKSPLPALGGV